MRLILVKDVRGIGRRGEIKEVRGGYARNYLIPQGLAKLATPAAIKELSALRADLEKKTKEVRERLMEAAEKIREDVLIFPVRAGKEGVVFGSVTAGMITDELQKKNIITDDDKVDVNLNRPIKELGLHEVEIDFKEVGIKEKAKIELRSQE